MFNSEENMPSPMLQSDAELLLQRRTEELLSSKLDIADKVRQIIANAIAREEIRSQLTNKKLDLMGIAKLSQLWLAMEGAEQGNERDIAMKLPKPTEEAIEFLIDHRSKGLLKSVQAESILALVTARSEFKELKELQEQLKAISVQAKAANLGVSYKVINNLPESKLEESTDGE